jgi:pimeloyl-ACP methyl ester carboxylesterase
MRLKHGHISLNLQELRSGSGFPLLLLHELRGSSADWGPMPEWAGAVYALDFSGHGGSDWLAGGGYYPELLVGDADAALAYLGRAAVAGAGLGAYVTLMLAGARAAQVPAALLLPGAGLEGGGPVPEYEAPFPPIDAIAAARCDGFDPFVEMLEYFVRPPDYACDLASAAQRVFLAEDGSRRPPWWEALRTCGNAEAVAADGHAALARLAAICGS